MMIATERCPACGAQLRDNVAYCVACGAPRPLASGEQGAASASASGPRCASCGATLRAGLAYCAACGMPRAELASAAPVAAAPEPIAEPVAESVAEPAASATDLDIESVPVLEPVLEPAAELVAEQVSMNGATPGTAIALEEVAVFAVAEPLMAAPELAPTSAPFDAAMPAPASEPVAEVVLVAEEPQPAPLAETAPAAAAAPVAPVAMATLADDKPVAPVAPAAAPEQWNPVIGPVVFILFLVIVALVILWGRAGYPLPGQ